VDTPPQQLHGDRGEEAFDQVAVDRAQERQELLVPMTAFHRADELAGRDLERGEQAGGAVPDIVEALPFGHAGQHRQHRRRAVQCLDLGLLVHAQHDRFRG
jgi:hypothetical protein